MKWETIDDHIQRSSVPDGWIIKHTEKVYKQTGYATKYYNSSICFYPDPDHKWDKDYKWNKNIEDYKKSKESKELKKSKEITIEYLKKIHDLTLRYINSDIIITWINEAVKEGLNKIREIK